MNKLNALILILTHVLVFGVATTFTQSAGDTKQLACEKVSHRYGERFCTIREQTFAAPSNRLSVESPTNGGITVRGWNQDQMLVRSRISVWSENDAEALTIAANTRIELKDNRLGAVENEDLGKHAGVSFEIFVPHNSNLSLKVHNGGVKIADLRGQIQFDVVNGGAKLERLAGDVSGWVVNGGLNVELAGESWDGAGMNVRATNGGVSLTIPQNYSARLETATKWGAVKIDPLLGIFSATEKTINANLGAGGAVVRAVTTNGVVKIKALATK